MSSLYNAYLANILNAAADLLRTDGVWIKNEFKIETPEGLKYSMLGAVGKFRTYMFEYRDCCCVLDACIDEVYGKHAFATKKQIDGCAYGAVAKYFNDASATTLADVLEVLEMAASRLNSEE